MPPQPTPAAGKPVPQDQQCPLCAARNGCAMAAGEQAHTCWCMGAALEGERIAQAVAAALAAEPLAQAACVCAACAAAISANGAAPKPAG